MKLKILFIANTIVSVPFGIGSVLMPRLFLSLFGATLGPAGALMMQYSGVWLIGIGLLTWLVRDAAASKMGRGIGLALFVAYLAARVVSLLGQLAGVLNALGWMPVAIQVFFSGSLGYLALAELRDTASAL
jgi:hypothetical protein